MVHTYIYFQIKFNYTGYFMSGLSQLKSETLTQSIWTIGIFTVFSPQWLHVKSKMILVTKMICQVRPISSIYTQARQFENLTVKLLFYNRGNCMWVLLWLQYWHLYQCWQLSVAEQPSEPAEPLRYCDRSFFVMGWSINDNKISHRVPYLA